MRQGRERSAQFFLGGGRWVALVREHLSELLIVVVDGRRRGHGGDSWHPEFTEADQMRCVRASPLKCEAEASGLAHLNSSSSSSIDVAEDVGTAEVAQKLKSSSSSLLVKAAEGPPKEVKSSSSPSSKPEGHGLTNYTAAAGAVTGCYCRTFRPTRSSLKEVLPRLFRHVNLDRSTSPSPMGSRPHPYSMNVDPTIHPEHGIWRLPFRGPGVGGPWCVCVWLGDSLAGR